MKEKLVSLPQQRQKKQRDEGERRRNTLVQFVLSLPRGQRGDGGAKEGGGREGGKEREGEEKLEEVEEERCSGF